MKPYALVPLLLLGYLQAAQLAAQSHADKATSQEKVLYLLFEHSPAGKEYETGIDRGTQYKAIFPVYGRERHY